MNFHSLSCVLRTCRPRPCRYYSSCRPRSHAKEQSPPPSKSTSRTQIRLHNLNSRLPRFLRTYTTPLLNAPVSHVTSFLILHEITAIVPLFGLAGAFHYARWIPRLGTWNGSGQVDEGLEKFERWLRKRSWIDGESVDGVISATSDADSSGETKTHILTADNGFRLILEFTTAYAITKALLPLRIVVTLWATPWFARMVIGPVSRSARQIFGRQKKPSR